MRKARTVCASVRSRAARALTPSFSGSKAENDASIVRRARCTTPLGSTHRRNVGALTAGSVSAKLEHVQDVLRVGSGFLTGAAPPSTPPRLASCHHLLPPLQRALSALPLLSPSRLSPSTNLLSSPGICHLRRSVPFQLPPHMPCPPPFLLYPDTDYMRAPPSHREHLSLGGHRCVSLTLVLFCSDLTLMSGQRSLDSEGQG